MLGSKLYYKEEERKCNCKEGCVVMFCAPSFLPLRYPSLRMRVRLCKEKLETLFDHCFTSLATLLLKCKNKRQEYAYPKCGRASTNLTSPSTIQRPRILTTTLYPALHFTHHHIHHTQTNRPWASGTSGRRQRPRSGRRAGARRTRSGRSRRPNRKR